MTRLEQRSFPRIRVQVEGWAELSSGQSIPIVVEDVSETGVLVVSHLRADLFDHVTLAFELRNRPLRLSALVNRVDHAADATWRWGCEWLDLPRSATTLIRRVVARADPMSWDGSSAALPERVARRFVPLIRAGAWKLASRMQARAALDADDLVASGFLALVETYARDGHLPEEDFERLARARIRGAMLDELRRADSLPRGVRRTARRLRAKRRELVASLVRAPSHAELASAAGMSQEDYAATARFLTPLPAVHVTSSDDEHITSDRTPEQAAEEAERLARAQQAYEALPARLRDVLSLYYGEQLTLRQIGAVVGVSEARISQLLSRALADLSLASEG